MAVDVPIWCQVQRMNVGHGGIRVVKEIVRDAAEAIAHVIRHAAVADKQLSVAFNHAVPGNGDSHATLQSVGAYGMLNHSVLYKPMLILVAVPAQRHSHKAQHERHAATATRHYCRSYFLSWRWKYLTSIASSSSDTNSGAITNGKSCARSRACAKSMCCNVTPDAG